MVVKRSSISEFKHSSQMTSCIAREKQGYVAYCMCTTCQEQAEGLPAVSSELRYCNKVLIICAFRFQYKRYPLHAVLGYLLAKTFFHKTHRGYKRSSGRKRYPSPIQTFVTISCCASSQGQPEKRHFARASPTCMLPGIRYVISFRKYTSTARGIDAVLKIYSSITVQARLGVLQQTSNHKRYFPPRTNICRNAYSHRPPSLKGQPLLREQGKLRVRFTKRLRGQYMSYYCNSTKVV